MDRNRITAAFAAVIMAACAADLQAGNPAENITPAPGESRQGTVWEPGQAFPRMSSPAKELDALDISSPELPLTEKMLFVCLQGTVNKTQPRIILFDVEREGKTKWPEQLGLEFGQIPFGERWSLVKKYENEIRGIILYSTERSGHYVNVASTVAGLLDAIPATEHEMEMMKAEGISLPVLEDLTGLVYERPSEIYQYVYDNWWEKCNKRLLISQNPEHGYIRDLGVAAGSAIVWLDPRNHAENTVLRKFLRDMKAGESIMAGWWADERSGIGIGTEYGISTVPADFYENATVYSGMDHTISLPPVPKMPDLENKIYIAVFLSDGDNIQYCQHTMSMLWDNAGRGTIPINWTVSPALADLGPGLLNWYYSSATEMDCLVSGPSGLGYALIYDAHNRVWNTDTMEEIDPYTRLTGRYLEKSGLRVITIWDEVNRAQMESYTKNCRYLYGVTLEDWGFHDPVKTVEMDGRLAFMPNYPCYASGVDKIFEAWKDTVATFDGSHPVFLAAQGESWKMGPDQMARLKSMLEGLAPGKIEICRGDHFFMLYNRNMGMSFNLTMLPEAEVTVSSGNPDYAADGTPATLWSAKGKDTQYVCLDFGDKYAVDRYVVRHASSAGLGRESDIRAFTVEASLDGIHWKTIGREVVKSGVTDTDIPETDARYIRISAVSPAADGISRIGDMEIFGRKTE